VAARIRRDSKSAFEQRSLAVPCGDRPMVSVPLVGRAIRVYGQFYALCSYCASCVRVVPANRYGAEICCLRCCPRTLGREDVIKTAEAKRRATQRLPVCRFCGKGGDASSKWKVIRAPHDTSGENARLPPALRTVVYCSTHWRNWIASAHRTLSSRVVLSHLALGAKPIAHDAAKNDDFEPPRRRRRRKK
jgi:hypothetical protein